MISKLFFFVKETHRNCLRNQSCSHFRAMILSVRQDFTQCHIVISVCLHTYSRMMKGTMREQEINEMKKKIVSMTFQLEPILMQYLALQFLNYIINSIMMLDLFFNWMFFTFDGRCSCSLDVSVNLWNSAHY